MDHLKKIWTEKEVSRIHLGEYEPTLQHALHSRQNVIKHNSYSTPI